MYGDRGRKFDGSFLSGNKLAFSFGDAKWLNRSSRLYKSVKNVKMHITFVQVTDVLNLILL